MQRLLGVSAHSASAPRRYFDMTLFVPSRIPPHPVLPIRGRLVARWALSMVLETWTTACRCGHCLGCWTLRLWHRASAVHGSGNLDGRWQVWSLSTVLNIQSTTQACTVHGSETRAGQFSLAIERTRKKKRYLLLTTYIVLHLAVAGCPTSYARCLKFEVEYMLVKVAEQLSAPTGWHNLWTRARRLGI